MTASATLGAALAAALVVAVGLRCRRSIERPRERHRPSASTVSVRRFRTPRRQRRSRRTEAARHVAAWCDDLARAIRGGSTLTHAVATRIPDDGVVAAETDGLRLALDRGAGITEGVNALDATPELRLALDVIAITADVGGQAAVPLERTAVVLRQRAADLDDRAVQAAQARTSAHVMTALPVAVLALLAVGDDDVVDALASPAGLVCVLCGSVLNVIGWCWMRRIVAVGS